jgi:hypothetical protein
MLMRGFGMTVRFHVIGHRVSEWERSRDWQDAERVARELIEEDGHKVEEVTVSNAYFLCSNCEQTMQEKDNFCKNCGEKA